MYGNICGGKKGNLPFNSLFINNFSHIFSVHNMFSIRIGNFSNLSFVSRLKKEDQEFGIITV